MPNNLPFKPTRWRLPISDPEPPLSLNVNLHWAQRMQIVKRLRGEAVWRGRAARIPRGLEHVHTRLFFRPSDRRRRDEDNIILTAKPLWDGLVDLGVVEDDTSEFMTKYMPRILPTDKEKPSGVWLDVWVEEDDSER